MELCEAEFGERAMQFYEKVNLSVHKEYLLVFYSTGLLIRAYTADSNRYNRPISNAELEKVHRYFEEAMPLEATFAEYAYSEYAISKMLNEFFVSLEATRVFYDLAFHEKNGFFEYFLAYLGLCLAIYEKEQLSDRATLPNRVVLPRGRTKAPKHAAAVETARHFNCFALCQSSGMGKSKNISALRNVLDTYIFDICMREGGEPDEPPRTPKLASAIKACKSKSDMLRVFAGCLCAQLASLGAREKPSLLDRSPVRSGLDGETSEPLWQAAHKAACDSKYAGLDEAGLVKACNGLLKELLAASERKRVIFSLDEAASLCEKRTTDGGSAFQDFLEALAAFPTSVFGLVLDASSQVHDFVPTKSLSQSAGASEEPTILFLLFFHFPTHGVLEITEVLSGIDTRTRPRDGSLFEGLQSNSFVVVFDSRPSFGAYVQGTLELAATAEGRLALMARVIAMASRKLGLGSKAVATEVGRSGPEAQRVKDDLSLALLSTRLGMLNLDSARVANLVTNHMATLVGVSPATSVLHSQYVVEPLIAVAAFGEMATVGRADELLGSVSNLLASGGANVIFTTGDAGEFAAALMRAYDHALEPLLADPTAPSYVGMPVTLGSYLDALLGPGALHIGGKRCTSDLPDGFVCILQTVIAEEKISLADLLEAFRLRYGIICRKDEYAVDFVIPIVLPSRKVKSIDDLTPSDMTGLLVQVRARLAGAQSPSLHKVDWKLFCHASTRGNRRAWWAKPPTA